MDIGAFVGIFVILSIALAFVMSRRVRHRISVLFERQLATEQHLAEARDRAQVAARAKTSFLANMSHEIRTPLNGMIGSIELLTETSLDSDQEELTRTLRTTSRALLCIVNDILDITKIESGRFELCPEPTDIRELVDGIIELFAAVAHAKGLRLNKSVAQDVPRCISVDANRLRQVLSNLVSNAVKFTSTGTISLRATVGEADNWIRFEIEDTGIGIADDHIERIFSRFEQADASTTRAFGGTGLGLALTRELVGQMGGDIEVSSEAGVGSTFWFTVAVTPLSDDSLGEKGHPSKQRRSFDLRVLLCEDNAVNAVITRRMLETVGCFVRHAVDGVEAVEIAREETFDVIFMDCQMPRMDGYEATRRILGDGKTAPIVALSANVMEEDLKRCEEAGMTSWVAKPVTIDALSDILMKQASGALTSAEWPS